MIKCKDCGSKASVQIIFTRKHRCNLCLGCAKISIDSGYAYKSLDGSPTVLIDIQLGLISIKDALRYYKDYPEVIKEIKNLNVNKSRSCSEGK